MLTDLKKLIKELNGQKFPREVYSQIFRSVFKKEIDEAEQRVEERSRE